MSAWCSTSRSCSPYRSATTSPTASPRAGIDEVEAAARAAGAHEFISHLAEGYDTVVGERGYTLSGGQRQRIAIARTLLVNPPIMVLDDATSAIDVQVEQMIHASLRVQMEGRTTLIIAHRLSTISLADRVVLLDQQKVVADGTHAELLESTPLYAEVLAQAAEFEREAELDGSTPLMRPRRGRSGAGGPARIGSRGRQAMSWGGGMAGGFGGAPGGFGRPAAPGLPFAGIPSELQDGVDRLLASEPDYAEPDIVFHQNGSERRAPPPDPLATADQVPAPCSPWPACWWWSSSIASQTGPKLTEIAINDGMTPGHEHFAVVVAMAMAYLVFIVITSWPSASRCRSPADSPPG